MKSTNIFLFKITAIIIAFSFVAKIHAQPDNFPGTSLEFDGIDDYVSGSGISLPLQGFQMEAWVCHSSLPGTVQRYITLDPEVAVLRNDGTANNGQIHFYMKSSSGALHGIRIDNILTIGEWFHITGIYDGVEMILYVNGELMQSLSQTDGMYSPTGGYSISSHSETMHGKIDEVRIWEGDLSNYEIRENMYLNQITGQFDIINYWQFNDVSGTTLTDCIGSSDGTLHNMDNSDWVNSSIPFGSGFSNTQTVNTTGNVVFSGTSLSMDFTSHSGLNSITVTRIDTTPNIKPTDPSEYICDSQYWVVNSYGSGSFSTDLTFTLNEDLNNYNQHDPASVFLYSRTSNSDESWTLLKTASSVEADANTATFNSITGFSQFLIARAHPDNHRGTALEFDGVDDYVELANNSDYGFDNSFTVETWIKPDIMSNGYHSIAEKGTEWQMKMFVTPANIVFEFGINNNSVFSFYSIDALSVENEWVHLAGVIDQAPGSQSTMLYVNGNIGVNETANPITTGSTQVKIGDGFKGAIDEFRIWKDAKTEQKIREYMHLTSTINDTLMSAYLQFNYASGNTAIDIAGGNEGTLYNMSTPDPWITSGVPAGGGTSYTQTETNGEVDFPGIGLSMFYQSQNGASITVSKINTSPNMNPSLFDRQYWFIDRYGSGIYNADLTFTVQEDITTEDEMNPGQIKLYSRACNADTYWEYQKEANSVASTAKEATFTGIDNFGQFAVCRRLLPDDFAGYALDFNGVDDSVSFGNNATMDIANNLTVEAWIKAVDFSHNMDIFRKGEIRLLFWDESFESVSGKGIQVKLPGPNTGWWEFQQDMNYNQWYHVAYSFADNGELKAYINGVNVRTGNFPGNITFNSDNMILSSEKYDWPYIGMIDELRIWNIVRTQDEIRENMYKPLTGLENGLISYWQLNEGSGNDASDILGGNNGFMYNMDNSDWINSTAPLPFISTQNGNWENDATWLDGQTAPDSSWARARIDHEVVLNSNKELTDLSITPSGILSVEPQIELTISDSLNSQAGNSGFVLKADNNGTASLLHNKPDIPATVESYISGDKWHIVSAPVNNALSAIFTGLYLMDFDEPTYTWEYIVPIDHDLAEGRGFMAWSVSGSTGDATVNYDGLLNNGDLSVNALSYTPSQPIADRGWNMAGNPYPSAIHWNAAWGRTNVDATMYVYDLGASGNYLTYNTSGTGTHPTGDLAPGQGFWVKANNTGASLTIPQSERKHSSQSFYKNSENPDQLLLTIEGNGYSDKMIVQFNDNATTGFDTEFDAWKFRGDEAAPQLYSVLENNELSVNSLPFEGESMIVPIGLEVGNNVIYTINVKGVEGFTESAGLYLEDLKEGQIIDLHQTSSYSFVAKPTNGTSRFLLHFSTDASGLESSSTENINIYSYGNKVYINFINSGNAKISLFDISGKSVYEKSTDEPFLTIPLDNEKGIYIVRVIRNGEVYNSKVHLK